MSNFFKCNGLNYPKISKINLKNMFSYILSTRGHLKSRDTSRSKGKKKRKNIVYGNCKQKRTGISWNDYTNN